MKYLGLLTLKELLEKGDKSQKTEEGRQETGERGKEKEDGRREMG